MENNIKAGAVANNSDYVPPKMWNELTDSEKIERMRETIKQLQWQISNANQNTNSLKGDFEAHAHLDGKVVKDIKSVNYGLLGASSLRPDPRAEASGEVYF